MKIGLAFKDALKNSWRLGSLTALITMLVSTLIRYFDGINLEVGTTGSLIDLKQQAIQQGIAPDLGKNIFNFLQGIFPFDTVSIVFLIVGSIFLVFMGRFLLNLGLPQSIAFYIQRPNMRKVSAILLYGMFSGALFLGYISGIGIWVTLFALLLYYITISLVLLSLMRFSTSVNRWLSK